MASKSPLGLDAKDLAILRILDQDVRASFTEIGRRARLSKEVVQYRMKRLEEEKIITGYWTFIKYLQGSVYKILIKNRNLSGKKKEEFIEYVKNHKIVSWFAEIEGNYDYLITIYTADDRNAVDFMKELLEKYGSFFKERHILKAFETNITNEKYLYPKGEFKYEYKNKFSNRMEPKDETEDKMMRFLSLNSRIKYTEMAEKLKLTPEAIKYRFKEVQRLIAGFKLRLNWEKLGLSYYHIFITLQDQSKREELLSFYKVHPDFNASMQHLGHYDLHIEIILRPEDIQRFMEEFLSRFGKIIEEYELLRIRQEFILNILK
ncbi:MAG: Lrp/AsnC family transcriptional regulator [Candidatus Woesearchaeota archaeon]